jgi:hypothetical protein
VTFGNMSLLKRGTDRQEISSGKSGQVRNMSVLGLYLQRSCQHTHTHTQHMRACKKHECRTRAYVKRSFIYIWICNTYIYHAYLNASNLHIYVDTCIHASIHRPACVHI